jgi:hypothetical protein
MKSLSRHPESGPKTIVAFAIYLSPISQDIPAKSVEVRALAAGGARLQVSIALSGLSTLASAFPNRL